MERDCRLDVTCKETLSLPNVITANIFFDFSSDSLKLKYDYQLPVLLHDT